MAGRSSARSTTSRTSCRSAGAHITLAGVLSEKGKQPEAAAERKTAAELPKSHLRRPGKVGIGFNRLLKNLVLCQGTTLVGPQMGQALRD